MTIPINYPPFSTGQNETGLSKLNKKNRTLKRCVRFKNPFNHGGRLLQVFCFQCDASKSVDANGSSPPGSKACNQNEEFDSLFYPVSSFTYKTPLAVVRIFRLLSM
ncbi:hypothetical protein [Chlorobaculum tepidum]|jgi:hypothetical protein|uniref:hypothetical protein n=1 Tax=Chlorobaculum tepidum TaxID=1097 RepID=UPI0013E8ACEE|nr:hypothetical protein [Chlorobaculum tepidum]